MKLIASGKAPDSILAQITEREQRLAQLEKDQAKYQTPKVSLDELQLRRFRKRAVELMGDFERTLMRNVPQARQAMRKLFRDESGKFTPLVFTPANVKGEKIFDFSGQINVGGMLYNVGAPETI